MFPNFVTTARPVLSLACLWEGKKWAIGQHLLRCRSTIELRNRQGGS